MLKGKAHLPGEPIVNGPSGLPSLPGLGNKNTGCLLKLEF